MSPRPTLLCAATAYLGALIACVTDPQWTWVLVLMALGGLVSWCVWQVEDERLERGQ